MNLQQSIIIVLIFGGLNLKSISGSAETNPHFKEGNIAYLPVPENRYHNPLIRNGSTQTWKLKGKRLIQSVQRQLQMNGTDENNHNSIVKIEGGRTMNKNDRSRFVPSRTQEEAQAARHSLGLLLLGYMIKGCLYFYGYFKLICLCMFLSAIFILLCPFLPFLIPALILILLVAAGLSIAIPLIATAAGGGDDLLLVTN